MNSPVEFGLNKQGIPVMERHSRSRSLAGDSYTRAFVTVAPGTGDDVLAAAGATVLGRRGDRLIVQLPVSAVEALEALEGIISITLETPVAPKMNLARAVTGIDRIHAGEQLPQAYTGRGVVAGIVDGGFDPNHVNFKNPDGSSRIVQFTYFRAQQNSSQLVEERHGAGYIPNIDTENAESFHATHTLGIMAGSYRGDATVAVQDFVNGHTAPTMACPYYGVATGADIATASAYNGQLSDAYIALGVESILDVGFGMKQPCAINLSLGSNVGPHDGSSPICQYLDAVVDNDEVNTIVVISAGNEGDMPIAIKHTVTESDTTVSSLLTSEYNGIIPDVQNPRMGQVYIYSDSPEPFEVQGIIVNSTRNAVAMRMPLAAAPQGDFKYWCSSEEFVGYETDVVSPQLAGWFEGYMGVNAQLDTQCNRYMAVIDFLLWDVTTGTNATGRYIPGFQVISSKKNAGQRIEIYGDGSMCYLDDFDLKGYTPGSGDGTINDIACGRNTIVVGSYNVRDNWASVDCNVYGYEGRFNAGEMTSFTSYGHLPDGRSLPHVCAPGATIISSSNEYYLDEVQAGDESRQASFHDGTRRHSWHQCVGTSMAAPVVTGTLALWLEAYPQLTAAEARDILQSTASRDLMVDNTGDPCQWGAGKLNAYEGLKKVLALKEAGIGNVTCRTERLNVTPTGDGIYELLLPGALAINATVHDLAGKTVATAASSADTATLDMSHLAPGVYIINVKNAHTLKVMR